MNSLKAPEGKCNKCYEINRSKLTNIGYCEIRFVTVNGDTYNIINVWSSYLRLCRFLFR